MGSSNIFKNSAIIYVKDNPWKKRVGWFLLRRSLIDLSIMIILAHGKLFFQNVRPAALIRRHINYTIRCARWLRIQRPTSVLHHFCFRYHTKTQAIHTLVLLSVVIILLIFAVDLIVIKTSLLQNNWVTPTHLTLHSLNSLFRITVVAIITFF